MSNEPRQSAPLATIEAAEFLLLVDDVSAPCEAATTVGVVDVEGELVAVTKTTTVLPSVVVIALDGGSVVLVTIVDDVVTVDDVVVDVVVEVETEVGRPAEAPSSFEIPRLAAYWFCCAALYWYGEPPQLPYLFGFVNTEEHQKGRAGRTLYSRRSGRSCCCRRGKQGPVRNSRPRTTCRTSSSTRHRP